MLTRPLVHLHVACLVRHLAIPQYTGRGTRWRHVQHAVLKGERDIAISWVWLLIVRLLCYRTRTGRVLGVIIIAQLLISRFHHIYPHPPCMSPAGRPIPALRRRPHSFRVALPPSCALNSVEYLWNSQCTPKFVICVM